MRVWIGDPREAYILASVGSIPTALNVTARQGMARPGAAGQGKARFLEGS
jgi:hypothetical protein